MKGNKKWTIFLFVILVVLSIKYLSFFTDPSFFSAACLTYSSYIPFIIIAAMIVQSIVVPLPSSAIAISAGALCGVFLGSLYIWIGALIGASLCFFISKRYGRSFLKGKFSSGKTEKINNFMVSYGFFAILGARLIPLISFDIISYGAGLTTISFRRFFIATAIGIIPGTLFYTWLGLTILRFETLGLVLTLIIISAMVYYLKS